MDNSHKTRKEKMTHKRKIKTNKSFLKRIKITGSGKILKRPPGQNHFNAKDSGIRGQRKHGNIAAPSELTKKVKALIKSSY